MSSVKDSLLGAPPSYGAVKDDQTVVAVEAGHDDAHVQSVGSGCVSFHNVSYVASSCFRKQTKVILNSVR